MTPAAERRALLPPTAQAALLAAIAGYVDAVGFLRYQGFACQITGNTVLLALALFRRSWEQSLYYVAMIACFTIGVLLASGPTSAGGGVPGRGHRKATTPSNSRCTSPVI